MKKQHNIHTDAVKMASDDIRKVIATFSDGPKFMQQHTDPRTAAKHERVAASPAAQDRIARGLPADYADRVARALGSN